MATRGKTTHRVPEGVDQPTHEGCSRHLQHEDDQIIEASLTEVDVVVSPFADA